MSDKRKIWILLAVRKFSKKEGVSANYLFNNRADFFSNDFPSFLKILKEMEQEDFIKLNQKFLDPYYSITKEGKSQLRKVFFSMGQLEQRKLMRTVPLWDLEDRISMIEGFIGSFLIIGIIAIIIILLEKYEITNTIIKTITGIFMLIFFIFSLFFASSIIFNFLYDFIRKFSTSFIELIEPYKKIITYIFVGLLIIGGLFAFVSLTKYDWSDIIFYGVMAIMGSVVMIFLPKILNKIKEVIKPKTSQHQNHSKD